MNLGTITTRSATYWPDKLAVIDSKSRLSFRELETRTNNLATGLIAHGFKQGSHIAIQSENCSELVEAEIAFYKAGMVKVPINARLTPEETVHVLNDSQARAIIASKQHTKALLGVRDKLPMLEKLISIDGETGDIRYADILQSGTDANLETDPDDSDISVLHYTSGSSGVLKAAMQTFGNRKAVLRKMLVGPSAKFSVETKMAHVGPITHASGMMMLPVLSVGGCNVLLQKFDVEQLLQTIQKEEITQLFLVPTMINRMINHPEIKNYDMSSLTNVLYGAAPMAPSVVEKAMSVFGPILAQGYGASETNSMVTMLTVQDHIDALKGDKKRLSSCGRCYFETDVRILNENGNSTAVGEVGEIVVRGGDIMKGYWNAPELTEEAVIDGAYHTGDLATVDEEGYIFIVDRKKDMIISGGFNIYPTEIEKVLYEHPYVYETAVVGVPNDEWGEAVKAVIVRQSGSDVSVEQIMAFCKDALPGFKRPRSVDFVDELPKNPNGKIARRQIRDAYWANSVRKVG